jgi:hypothetical protein
VKKRIGRIITILLIALLHFVVMAFILLQSGKFQSFVTGKVVDYFAKEYQLKVSIKKFDVKLPARIGFSGLYFEDQTGDTLLFAEGVFVKISDIKIFSRKLYIDKVELDRPYLNMYIDSLGIGNTDFVMDLFTSTDSSESEGFDVFVNEFSLVDARINFNDYTKDYVDNGFDPAHIKLYGLSVNLIDFQMYGDTIELDLNQLCFKEYNGINVYTLSTHLIYHPLGILLENLELATPNSVLNASLKIEGEDDNYLSDPINTAKIDLTVDTCSISVIDVRNFLPDLGRSTEKIHFAGSIKGKLSDIKLIEFKLKYGYQTHLFADLNINGLPDLESTFIFGDVSDMQISVYDIERLLKVISGGKDPGLPENAYQIGLINFRGNLVGLYNDLVAYGEFKTPVGSLKTDISIKNDLTTGVIYYDGLVKANDIDLERIMLNDDKFGKVSFDSKLKGTIDTLNQFAAEIDIKLSRLGLFGYNYSNIAFNGSVSNTMFNGELIIKDPNMDVEFIGSYDNTTGTPIFDFASTINADLYKTNLDTSAQSTVELLLIADFEGNDISTMKGLVQMRNLSYSRDSNLLVINELDISTGIRNNNQFISINSDLLDANIEGIFSYTELSRTVPHIIDYYLPTLNSHEIYSEVFFEDEISHFDFDITFQYLDDFTAMFLPSLIITDTIKIFGGFYADMDTSFVNVKLPNIKYDSIMINAGKLDLVVDKKMLGLRFIADSIINDKFVFFENPELNVIAQSDSVKLNFIWNDYDTVNYSGNINLSTRFEKSEISSLPKLVGSIYPSHFIVADTRWDIDSSNVVIDSIEIEVNNFKIKYQNQVLRLDGFVSEQKDKLLRFYLQNVDLENLNFLLEDYGYELGGILTASGRFASLYNQPVFTSSLSINRFSVNEEDFGRFDISADWLESENGFRLMGSNYFLKFNGNYVPQTDSIDFVCDINNFKLEILDPYLRTYEISGTKGLLDGKIFARGELKSPEIGGYVEFERAELTYDYLKLHLILDDTVKITNDAILFENFVVKDEKSNKGIINGGVYHNNFKDISFGFEIVANNLKMMNTTENDNQLFYGTAYGSGDIKIAGDMEEFGISVDVKTEPNTVFVLPMTEFYEAGDNNLITFIAPEDYQNGNENGVVSLPSPFKYSIDLNIELTPDAEAQIVFDPKVGDLIRGYSNGNLNIYYDSDETFNMTGDVEIVRGNYLFTMQNIINKKFEVKRGGTIVWSGDPYEASLDLDAVYNVRAPLTELMAGVDTSAVYRKLTNVECIIHMKENLMSPMVSFDINIPSADDKVKSQLMSLSDDEKNKQVLYLLIMNRFYTPEYMVTDGGGTGIPVGMTASEWASNQISNWLSQISKDFDIGLKYRPGDEFTPQEVEVALSTQLFNDRVLIDGNVGLTEQYSQASNIVGNVDIQWKITEKGNLRIKGYNHANSEFNPDFGTYTQGVGLFYTEDFNTFGGLMKKYWNAITFKKYRDKNKKE